jgi:hypothetical protein
MTARMILQMVQGLPPQEHVVFPFQIHVRASSSRGKACMTGTMFRMGESP